MTKQELEQAYVDYTATGNPAVDLVAGCITFHRNHVQILDKIYLRQDMYDMFSAWVESNGFKPVAGQGFKVENVDIDLSPIDICDVMEVVYREQYDTGAYKDKNKNKYNK
jgi:hypothetical protein